MTIDITPRKLLSLSNVSLPDFFDEGDWLNTSSHSGISIYEDENHVFIETAVPGIDPKAVDITYQDGYLWVRGEQEDKEEDKAKKYYRKATKSFSYRIAVPGDIDESKDPEASYKHGVMTISFKKSPKIQPKKIQLKNVES